MESMARVFHALGEPMRLRLLNALSTGEQSVNELVAATGTSQPNVSKHLSVLFNAGMLRRRKEGVKVYYALAGERPLELVGLMRATELRWVRGNFHLCLTPTKTAGLSFEPQKAMTDAV